MTATTTSAIGMISNKELKKAAKAAVKRGWQVQKPSGSTHFRVVHMDFPGHFHMLASSPSDRNARANFERRLKRCEEGRCEHGAPFPMPAITAKPAKKVAAKKADAPKVEEAPTHHGETFTTHEVAELIEKSPAFVLNSLVKKGRLTPVDPPRPGRMTRFYVEDVEKVAAELDKPKKKARKKAAAKPAKKIVATPPPVEAVKTKPAPKVTKPKSAPALEVEWARLEGMVVMTDSSALVAQLKVVKDMTEDKHG